MGIEKQQGIVAILDALGASSYSDAEVNQFLRSRERVFERHPLRTDELLRRLGKEGAGFHGRVVGSNETWPATHPADAGDEAGCGYFAELGIHFVRGPDAEFKEWPAFIKEHSQPFAHGEST